MALESFQQFINGKFESANETFESIDPATGESWATMPKATESDVDRAVQAARCGQDRHIRHRSHRQLAAHADL